MFRGGSKRGCVLALIGLAMLTILVMMMWQGSVPSGDALLQFQHKEALMTSGSNRSFDLQDRQPSGALKYSTRNDEGGQSRPGQGCKTMSDLPLGMMERDVTWSEEWPEVEMDSLPGQAPESVHYVWCGGNRQFTFPHYVGLLSALRVLKPLKIYFHYTHSEPVVDNLWYNNWFQEFKQFVPVVHMKKIDNPPNCKTTEFLTRILGIVAENPGVYLGEKILLAGVPSNLTSMSSWFAFPIDSQDATQGVIYVREKTDVNTLKKLVMSKSSHCVMVDTFNDQGHGPDRKCIVMGDAYPKYPRDIWGVDTPFGELARWCFYGRRPPYRVKRDPENPIPRITHYTRTKGAGLYNDLSFYHYISILSALYVGGFEHVYIHSDTPDLTGTYWDDLKSENITIVKLQKPDFVYDQKVIGITHFSDISRYNIIYRYGGAYQDFDCLWINRIPDAMLEYPMVISPAISENGLWPDGMALGMLMAKKKAPFIRHAFKGYRDYKGNNYLYNAIMRSYRTYEHYPDTVNYDPHFSVFCVDYQCKPRWQRNKPWDISPKNNGGRGQKWTSETLSFHLVIPKPPMGLKSPQDLKSAQTIIGDVARMILKKSGRSRILDES